MCTCVSARVCAREWADSVSKRRKVGRGAPAVLIVINHLGAQNLLTLALFDLHRSKMVGLK